MKAKFILSVAFVMASVFAYCQTSTETRLKRISTPHYEPVKGDSNYINILMDFNDMVPIAKFSKVPLSRIQSISLVYTKFKVSETFDQLSLNQQRIEFLYNTIPGLKEKKNIQWIWIEQTGCNDPSTCKEYFHGLVINLRSKVEMLTSSLEAASTRYYMDIYGGKTPDSKVLDSLSNIPGSNIIKKCYTREIKEKTSNAIGKPRTWSGEIKGKILKKMNNDIKDNNVISLQIQVNEKGIVTTVAGTEQFKQGEKIEDLILKELKFTRSRYNGKFRPTDVILNIYRSDGIIKTNFITKPVLPEGVVFDLDSFNYTIKHIERCSYIDTSKRFSFDNYEPPVVIKVLERNRKWKNCLVATDVTGSMAPYLGQFLYWHKLNLKANDKNDKFVFFNDGDNMHDNLKRTGQVGGVYSVSTKDYRVLLTTLQEAQQNGSGGDGPENNFEAALKGLKEFPACEGIIMIADNWATPRDISLFKQIKVPVHFIMCGTYCGINPEYLNLVYKNGGSIHTIESDIERLSKLKENQEIVIGPQTFILKNGKFVSKTTLAELGCYPGGGWGQ